MKNNFNGIAWSYDRLAKLIFGNSINKSQTAFLEDIPNHSKVLIVGGGTGWILEDLDKLNKTLTVEYVDLSSKMIEKAKQRAPFMNLQVTFKTESYQDQAGKFDIIITNFFLDVFDEKHLPKVIQKLKAILNTNGKWYVTDFKKGAGWWQDLLIASMYLFFRVATNLEGRKLLNFDYWMRKNQLHEVGSKKFYHGMIKTGVYKLS